MMPDPPAARLAVDLRRAVGGGRFHIDVRFRLHASEAILFGPSGAGKSTLLRLLAGLLRPDDGAIHLDGIALCDTSRPVWLPAGHRGIGYLTQEPALFPHLTVAANIDFGLHGLDRSSRAARREQMLAAFALQPLTGRLPRHLSGGERQRVALARALAPAPRLLLLDEPIAALDPKLREQTIAALRTLLGGEPDPTLLFWVSHDVAEVYASDAEVLQMEQGRIVAQGPSREVLADARAQLLRKLGR